MGVVREAELHRRRLARLPHGMGGRVGCRLSLEGYGQSMLGEGVACIVRLIRASNLSRPLWHFRRSARRNGAGEYPDSAANVTGCHALPCKWAGSHWRCRGSHAERPRVASNPRPKLRREPFNCMQSRITVQGRLLEQEVENSNIMAVSTSRSCAFVYELAVKKDEVLQVLLGPAKGRLRTAWPVIGLLSLKARSWPSTTRCGWRSSRSNRSF